MSLGTDFEVNGEYKFLTVHFIQEIIRISAVVHRQASKCDVMISVNVPQNKFTLCQKF